MMRRIVMVSSVILFGLCLFCGNAWAEGTYQPVTSDMSVTYVDNAVGNSMMVEGVSPTYYHTDTPVVSKQKIYDEGHGDTVQFTNGALIDGVSYNICIQVSNVGDDWSYVRIMPSHADYLTLTVGKLLGGSTNPAAGADGEPFDCPGFTWRRWLENPATNEKVTTINGRPLTFFAGPVYVSSKERVQIFSDNNTIFTNIPDPATNIIPTAGPDDAADWFSVKGGDKAKEQPYNKANYFLTGISKEGVVTGSYGHTADNKPKTAQNELTVRFALPLEVTYTTDGNGTVGKDQEYVDVEKSPEGTTATPNENYEFEHWTADKDVILDDGTTIAAGDPITPEQVKKIIVTSDLQLMAHFKTKPVPETPVKDEEPRPSQEQPKPAEKIATKVVRTTLPKTGDDTSIVPIVVVGLVGVGLLAASVAMKKKKDC